MYLVESFSEWFIVAVNTKRQAHKEGVFEFGKGNVKHVRKATPKEVKYFQDIKGKDATKPSVH